MRTLLAAAAAILLAAAPAHAQESSPNVERLATIPETASAISINFIDDVMFVSTVTGLFSYDVSDLASPQRLGVLPMYIWENEDVDVDPVRKRVFISRDPRGFTSPATPGSLFPRGAVHVIDVSDPRVMTQIGFFTLPAGHTSTCVNDCDFLWTGGPGTAPDQPSEWNGRPIFATDVRDPANPVPCPEPIDTGRNDGTTDYAHDVQVDGDGVAWVSGAGGVRGYWTDGRHRDPVTRTTRTATPCDPIPYGGSGTPESATPSRFMHNSFRDTSRKAKHVLYGTEENITSDCATSGRFVTYDLRGTLRGEGFGDTATTKHRMKVLDTWTPEDAEGSSGCASAHYFSSRGDGVFANAFYEQGVRFLDVSRPRHIRQIGWYRPGDANTWAAYWHKGVVFVADLTRGVDVLRFEGGDATVKAPAPRATRARAKMDPASGYLCPLKVAAPNLPAIDLP